MTVTIGRRELLAALGGAAAVWPLAVRAVAKAAARHFPDEHRGDGRDVGFHPERVEDSAIRTSAERQSSVCVYLS